VGYSSHHIIKESLIILLTFKDRERERERDTIMVTIDNELQFEYKRLETFKNGEWPYCEIDPAPLAKEGFCYTGKSDCCVCAFCRGTVRGWRCRNGTLSSLSTL